MSDFSAATPRPRRFLRSLAGLALLGACALATACGTSNDTKKQLGALQEQLTVLQNTNDRLEDRVSALELANARKPTAAAPASSDTGLLARPPLKVVKVDPTTSTSASSNATDDAAPGATEPSSASSPQEEDDAARPLIRGSGEKLEARNVSTPATAGKNSSRAKPGAVGQTH